jgi:hypothetical protein
MPGSDDGVDSDAPASLAAQYWHHHFRRLFHKQVLLLLLPTLCDLVGAALLNIGEVARQVVDLVGLGFRVWVLLLLLPTLCDLVGASLLNIGEAKK